MAGVNDQNAFKAGVFILATLAVAVGILWVVSGRTFGGEQRRTVVFALSDDVAGLSTGSEVRVGGKTVGSVESVRFGDGYGRVLVDVSLPPDLPLREGASARVQATLTGVTWLNFLDLGDGELLAGDAAVPGATGSLDDVIEALASLAPDARATLATLRDRTLPAAEEALANVSRAAASAEALVGDDSAADDLKATLAQLREGTRDLPRIAADAETLIGSATSAVEAVQAAVDETGGRLTSVLAKADGVADDVREASTRFREASASAGAAIDDVQLLVARNRGQVNVVIDRLASTSQTLDLAASEIRRSPWRLLYRPDGRQRDSLDLFDAARRFAEGAAALQDAAVALEGAVAGEGADAGDVAALLERVRERFEAFDEAERALFERLSR